jgi:hypothetical protein
VSGRNRAARQIRLSQDSLRLAPRNAFALSAGQVATLSPSLPLRVLTRTSEGDAGRPAASAISPCLWKEHRTHRRQRKGRRQACQTRGGARD